MMNLERLMMYYNESRTSYDVYDESRTNLERISNESRTSYDVYNESRMNLE
jgi:hypothetical protein